MSELRWNPILREWVATATHRMDRPQMPKDWCPFCPGSGKVPEEYDVYVYPNDFPTFRMPPYEPIVEGTGLFLVRESAGVCEVVLYTSEHDTTLTYLPLEHIVKLIRLWRKRYEDLGSREEIQYVFEFENKGEVIGVTMPHPHGQIYAFPYVPPKIQTELDAAEEHRARTGRCLFCDVIEEERRDGRRVLLENEGFVAIVPFFARYPYEVNLFPRRHLLDFTQFEDREIWDLARILKCVLLKYDNLYGFSFPYMMIIHQQPTDGGDHSSYHFHIEFLPPYRSRTKLKYLAGCESGAGTFINDSSPEEKAQELRETEPRRMEDM